jgi:FkbM family methyltransferase
MPSIWPIFVEAFKISCDADRAIHNVWHANGLRRRFYSTKGQDRWVVRRIFEQRRYGFFVDIGAVDGRTHSNTYVLERDYGWTGIAAEPNPLYFSALSRNRKCACVQACIDARSGEVDFYTGGFLGGIIDHDTDNTPKRRGPLFAAHPDRIIRIKAVSLQELLESKNAPRNIDYLSLDVEGAELRVLSTFPFQRFTIGCLTVERPTRAIHKLLVEAGYVLDRIYRYDGFYVSQVHAQRLGIKTRSFSGIGPKAF